MPPIPKKMPPITELKATYYQLRSIHKTARHHGVAEFRVRLALDEAGVSRVNPGEPKEKAPVIKLSKHRCESCRFARADLCAFMRASIDRAESVLVAAGCEYKVKALTCKYGPGWAYTKTVPVFTVTDCPKWKEGSVAV